MKYDFKLGDNLIMKKPHACGANTWTILRTGIDIKIKCNECGREVMLERMTFEKKVKKIIGENNEKTK